MLHTSFPGSFVVNNRCKNSTHTVSRCKETPVWAELKRMNFTCVSVKGQPNYLPLWDAPDSRSWHLEPPDASILPSGLNAMVLILFIWFVKSCLSRVRSATLNRRSFSPRPATANCAPSGLNSRSQISSIPVKIGSFTGARVPRSQIWTVPSQLPEASKLAIRTKIDVKHLAGMSQKRLAYLVSFCDIPQENSSGIIT